MTRVRHFSRSSLARLLLGYVLVSALFAGAWLWTLSAPLTSAVAGQQRRNLTALAQSAALLVSESGRPLARIADQLVARTDIRLTIIAADGTVLADSDQAPAGMENHARRPEVIQALAGKVGFDQRTSKTEGTEQMYVALAASRDGHRVVVRVAQPFEQIRALAASSRRLGVLALLLSTLIAVAVALWAARSAATPVQELSRAAESMANGNLDARLPEVPSDLAELARGLDDLRSQVRARLDALGAERASLRAALDGLAESVLVVERGRVTLANRATTSLFGGHFEDWTDTPLAELPLPAALAASVKTHVAEGRPVSYDLEPDPTGRVYRLTVAPLVSDPSANRVLVSIGDVTERARLWAVRRDFVANASHELKTPVAAIKLLSDAATMAATDGDVEQAVAFAGQLSAETERLQRLVKDLLDLSRLETVPSAAFLTDLRAALTTAIAGLKPSAARKGLDLVVDLTSVADVDVYLAADPTDVAVAVDNLVDNAIAYTEHGSVTIRACAEDEEVLVTVSDTGDGIPADQLDRIFERFYRVDRARSRDSGGTGLGLALVKHSMERNGGSVEVSSEPNTGSTFTLRFRRAR